ncbi:nectin-1 isoform X1 [Xenopus tropicalis]|uniref:Nectin-1 isoform X1 n=1 Tax=Xenopus tropicalis TaxID=8364 RepID=A0A8J0T5X6_XENTR|nr:nectin-1 isoform X1 [Xenopus tropicalis]|eukprot:XP_017951561.1 PREDICTED: nectin-1 isoform X1 [Xenopus tropicalis]
MAPRRNGDCCSRCLWWPLTISVLASVFQGVHSQMVLVNETVSGYIGDDVMLHCNFVNAISSVKITQVTWQKSTNGSKQNVAIYNPSMGMAILPPYKERVSFLSPSFRDGTIKLTRLQLEDEGAYICEFATFPTGNRESQLNLTVLAKPVNHMEGTSKQLIAVPGSTKKVVVATCISANGKPPSSVNWETKLKGEAEFQEIKHDNGTVTVISRYLLVPNREAHRQPLTCVINYQTERYTQTVLLSVLYEPHVAIEGFDGNWYVRRPEVKLTCTADANPPPSLYEWRMANGSLPDNAIVNNNTLHFRGEVTYGFSGTYICEAKNAIGSRTGQVEVNVTDKPLPQGLSGSLLGIIGGAVAAFLLIIAAVSAFVVRRKKQKQRSDTDSDMTDLPPSHKPAPPPKKKPEMKTPLTAHDIQVVHLDPVKAEEEIITLPIQTTYYDISASDNSPYCEQRRFGEHCPKLPEARDFLSGHCTHEEDYLDQLHPGYVPLSFFLQDSFTRQTPEPNFCYATAGSRAPYVCPKEQYV